MVSGMLLIFIISTTVGFVSGLTHILYRSKCTKVWCGCCGCERDIVAEEELDEMELRQGRRHQHEMNATNIAGGIINAEMNMKH
jgi:hypothetical protein